MFQERVHTESSTLSISGSYPLSETSSRAAITATMIREEAAESLLPGIQGDVELLALTRVLNRYDAPWWLKHVKSVGADPVSYWSAQLGEEIKVTTRGKNSPTLKKKFPWSFFRSCSASVTYDLIDLDLDPFYEKNYGQNQAECSRSHSGAFKDDGS
jgi:hypothetical protein